MIQQILLIEFQENLERIWVFGQRYFLKRIPWNNTCLSLQAGQWKVSSV